MRLKQFFGILAVPCLLQGGVAMADSGFYIGASVGSAGLTDDFDGFDIDDDTEAYRILGGLQLGRNLGIEAGYMNFGDFEERFDLGGLPAVTRFTADGWTIGGVLNMPLSESVSLLARGGWFAWDADVEVNGVRAAFDDDSNPYYGAGGRVSLTPAFALTGDWSRYELDDIDTDVFSIGFEYRFGN